MKQRTYRILITPEEEGGFSVSVPSLPGCFTQGETIDEAIAMAKEAVSLYIEKAWKRMENQFLMTAGALNIH